jgi:hypothetical protein
MRRGFYLSLLVAAAAACLSQTALPGDEVMGHFVFSAEPLTSTCAEHAEFSTAPFEFEGTFTRSADQQQVWFTLGSVPREATFDGQVMRSRFSAARRFAACACVTGTQLDETLEVALVSASQNQALGGRCPEQALDGGIPVPNPDAGILPPGSTELGFDAIRACGFLTDTLVPPEQGCACGACTAVYRVNGVRR